jgi:hypothetical protein
MSLNNNPSDPFSNINFEDFKSVDKNTLKGIDEEAVRRVAEENSFQSRQPVQVKEKITTKSFSLFPSDQAIINQAIKRSLEKNASTPSGSDIIRAALHAFAKLSVDQQDTYIQKYRGRGRNS